MKIQNRYLLFFFLSLLLSAVGNGLLFKANDFNQKLAAGMLIVVMAAFAAYNTFMTIVWFSRARRFWNAFSVNPPNDPNMNWKERSTLQPIVDERLKIEATYLSAFYEAENKILEKKPGSFIEATDRATNIANQSVIVESQKKIFWFQHKLAYEWGFEVYGDFRNYLTPYPTHEKNRK